MSISKDELELVLSIPGSTDENELSLLYDLAKYNISGCIVEVGSAKGKSTVALAMGSKKGNGVKVYAIEPHDYFKGILGGNFTPQNRKMFFESVIKSGTWDIINLVNLTSEIVAPGWREPVGLLFIDGDHSFEGVSSDFECWAPNVVENGIVVFHDSTDPNLGPYKLIDIILNSGDYVKLDVISRATILKKIGRK